MQLSKTFTIRKPKLYQSQCTFKTIKHYFPGIYNQQVCQTVSNDIKLFKNSGRTQEFTRHLIPKDILKKYGINGRANEKEDTTIKSMNCLLACRDTTFDVNVLKTKRFEKSCIMNLESFETNGSIHCLRKQSTNITKTLLQYSLRLSYLHPESYTIIEEKGLYNFSEMLVDIGRFLGLMVGASCLSILELVICIALMVLKRFFKYNIQDALREIPEFHLISLCGNFEETQCFRRVLTEYPETLRKLCVSTKLPQQEIRRNFGILRSERYLMNRRDRENLKRFPLRANSSIFSKKATKAIAYFNRKKINSEK